MVRRKIASIVLQHGKLVIPINEKVFFPSVSLKRQFDFIYNHPYTDLCVALANIDDFQLLSEYNGMNLITSINLKDIDKVNMLFAAVASKVFFRVDNEPNFAKVIPQMRALSEVYGKSAFGINIHYGKSPVEDLKIINEYNLKEVVSEVTFINTLDRRILNKDYVRSISKITASNELEVNFVCEINNENIQQSQFYNFNIMNQFQLFTRWSENEVW